MWREKAKVKNFAIYLQKKNPNAIEKARNFIFMKYELRGNNYIEFFA